MARGEGEREIHSRFVERASKIPVVGVAWDLATATYGQLKLRSRIARITLSAGEKSVYFVAEQARPVVRKFERQIQAVDDLAYKSLGTLEEKVPIITKPTDEIIGDTRKLYENTITSRIENIKKYGNDRVRSAADFGLRQANSLFGTRMVQSVLTSVDGVLVVTQRYVDYLLPPTPEEKQDKKVEEESGLARVSRISDTVRMRVYRRITLTLEYAQEKSLDILLVYPLTLIEISKTHVESAIEFANRLWLAIRQEETDQVDSAETSRVEQQLLEVARMLSKQVASAYALMRSPADGQDSPRAIVAARDGALWLLGMMKLVPQLLPMYIYGLAHWIEQFRRPAAKDEDQKPQQNGSVKPGQNGGVHSVVKNGSKPTQEDSLSDHSIPEEDEES